MITSYTHHFDLSKLDKGQQEEFKKASIEINKTISNVNHYLRYLRTYNHTPKQ